MDGRVSEVFLDASNASALGELAQESAIVASLALQQGCPVEVLCHALAGRNAGPLGVALDLIARPDPPDISSCVLLARVRAFNCLPNQEKVR